MKNFMEEASAPAFRPRTPRGARRLLLALAMVGIGTAAFVSPEADRQTARLAASVAPPLEGIDPRTGHRLPHPPPVAGQLLSMSIKTLGNFSFDPAHGSTIPADVRRLDGSQVQLSGYMLATAQAGEKINQFSLVPSLFACCYGRPPGVQHVVQVRCPAGTPTDFVAGLVQVQGVLHVREIRDGGYVVSLFEVDARQVRAG